MAQQTEDNDLELMTPEEAAKFLRVSLKTLYIYTCNSGSAGGQKRNRFPENIYIKLGRKVLFNKSNLVTWIQSGAQFVSGKELAL